jgi:hypothetical protein
MRSVTNKIAIKPQVDCANVKRGIEAALERHAEVEARAIRVTIWMKVERLKMQPFSCRRHSGR